MKRQALTAALIFLAACGADNDDGAPGATLTLPLEANATVSAQGWTSNQDAIGMLIAETASGNGKYDLQGHAELARSAPSLSCVAAGNGFTCGATAIACPTQPSVSFGEDLAGSGVQAGAPAPYTSGGLLVCSYAIDQLAWLHVATER